MPLPVRGRHHGVLRIDGAGGDMARPGPAGPAARWPGVATRRASYGPARIPALARDELGVAPTRRSRGPGTGRGIQAAASANARPRPPPRSSRDGRDDRRRVEASRTGRSRSERPTGGAVGRTNRRSSRNSSTSSWSRFRSCPATVGRASSRQWRRPPVARQPLASVLDDEEMSRWQRGHPVEERGRGVLRPASRQEVVCDAEMRLRDPGSSGSSAAPEMNASARWRTRASVGSGGGRAA